MTDASLWFYKDSKFINWDEVLISVFQVGLTLEQFWGDPDDPESGLTLHELNLACIAWQRNADAQWRMDAVNTRNIAGAWLGRKTPKLEDYYKGLPAPKPESEFLPWEIRRRRFGEDS